MGIEVDYMAIFDLVAWCAGRLDSDGWLLCWMLSNESSVLLVDTLGCRFAAACESQSRCTEQ